MDKYNLFVFRYVIKELVETERDYVKDLNSVVEGYIANLESMELPEDLQGISLEHLTIKLKCLRKRQNNLRQRSTDL